MDDNSKGVFNKIRHAVSKIPKGKVSTYGDIAKMVGIKDARLVGWAVYGNQNSKIPCHRVVNRDGCLAERFSLGGWHEQKKRLEPEGVFFNSDRKVDLKKCRWTDGKSKIQNKP